jgi:hypothetical protein
VLLARAVAHAAARGFDVGILVGARLAQDMLPFAGQIQRASGTAKFAAGRLTDLPSPRFADTEITLDELRQRIDATADYLKTFRPEEFDGSGERKISYNAGGAPRAGEWTGLPPEFRPAELIFPCGDGARHPPSQRSSHRQTRISRLRPGVMGHRENLGAALGEGSGRGTTDATRGAGDESGLS